MIKTTHDLKYASRTVAMLEKMFNEIYLVGGAVRDDLLSRPTHDLDFAVPYEPDEIISTLQKNKMPVYEQGKKFKTIGTSAGGFDIQITTYRSEVYSEFSRNPEVETLTDIYTDLDRRDFSINAMALSKNEFLDPHNGLDDLADKRIKSVLNPEQKFSEDPLRILRAYRLVSVYGFNIEENTRKAIGSMKDKILNLSVERVGEELQKLVEGEYWSDAIFELIESGVLNVCLDSFGMTALVITDNAFAVFDQYTSQELTNMTSEERWARLIEIIFNAEKNSGTSTLDIELTAEHLTLKSSLPKSERSRIKLALQNVHKPPAEHKEKSKSQTKEIKPRAERDLDRRWSKLRTLKAEGKDAYYASRQFGVAIKTFEEAISVLDSLYTSALEEIANDLVRRDTLRKLSRTYVDILGFVVASYIMAERLYSSTNNTHNLEKKLRPLVKAGRLNKRDYKHALHEGIAHVYRENLIDNNLEDFERFITRDDSALPEEKKSYLLRSYFAYIIRNEAETPTEKMKLNKKLANLIKRQVGENNLGLDYFDPFIDYLYFSVLASSTIEEYSKRYDSLMQNIPDYLAVANSEGKSWYAQKRAILNSARCNIHALGLSSTVNEKQFYASRIVEDYIDAGKYYKKNADRYRIYEDWFTFVQWISYLAYESLDANEIKNVVRQYPSYGYIDQDEDYFKSKLGDLAEIRDLMVDIYRLLDSIDVKSSIINDHIIQSIKNLYLEQVISKKNALMALKNYVTVRSKLDTESADFYTEDISLSKKDESEIDDYLRNVEGKGIEFKSSWKYDVNRSDPKQAKANVEISMAIAHTITAFMNTDGGTILIGVRNDKEVCGIEETDAKLYTKAKNIDDLVDKIKLEIDDIFEHYIGQEFQDYKELNPRKYKGKTVLVLKVRKVDTRLPVKFDQQIFIRGEGGTRSLSSADTVGYMEKRFMEYANKDALQAR